MGQLLEYMPGLPPRDFWLIEPGEKLDTPTDSRGIVDVDATVSLVKSQIDPVYQWNPHLGIHHFEHPASNFPDRRERGRPNPRVFANLPPHKGVMPREFENFLHTITLPPPVPDEEVMRYRIEAWKVASALFKKARQVVIQERQRRQRRDDIAANPHIVPEEFDGQDVIGEEIMQEILARGFKGIDYHLEQNSRLPAEFRFFDSESPFREVTGNLGRIVMPRAVKLNKRIAAAA